MRRRTFLSLILSGLLCVAVPPTGFAVEQLDLTTPETFSAPSSITYWRIDELHLYKAEAKVIIGLVGTNGEKRTFTFVGSTATAYINAMNKRDATVTSNEKWTLTKLKDDGYLAGTVTGTPD